MKKIHLILTAVVLYFLIAIGIAIWDVHNRSQVLMPVSGSAVIQEDISLERNASLHQHFAREGKTGPAMRPATTVHYVEKELCER